MSAGADTRSDAAQSQIALANEDKKSLGLDNVDFMAADLCVADRHVFGDFDFIIAHGVFSWIPDATREAMLAFCARRLRRDGLLYLNYNTFPGWQVRGLIRRLLLAGTHQATGLHARALLAQDIATQLAATLSAGDHAFTQLLVRELQFVWAPVRMCLESAEVNVPVVRCSFSSDRRL